MCVGGTRRSLDLGELVLAYAAYRAYPIVGQVFKLGAGSDTAFGVAYCGVVIPIADFANVFVHSEAIIVMCCYNHFVNTDGETIVRRCDCRCA